MKQRLDEVMQMSSKMKQEFEKLPEIESALNDAEWSEITGRYLAKRVNHYMASTFVNGALYAYKEQQKLIEEKECILTEIEMIISDDGLMYETMIERIMELLK